jgi:hypothetical protein
MFIRCVHPRREHGFDDLSRLELVQAHHAAHRRIIVPATDFTVGSDAHDVTLLASAP